MPAKRVLMKKIKRILELRFAFKLSHRAIGRDVGIGRGSVSRILERATVANLTWPLPDGMTDAELEAILYPSTVRSASAQRPVPKWAEVQLELTKHRTLTLAQLWKEYIAAHPEGYQYSRYCDLYRSWRSANMDPVMRHTHKAGDRLFVDYSGKKPCVVDPDTGEVRTVELFVAVLGASNYLYAEATETQKTRDFCGSVRRTLEFLGGVPRAIVPDNLKAAVIQFKKDDVPVLNESFRDLTEHYQVGVLPARPRKPRDKGKAESGVLVAQRKILAVLRNVTFFGIQELNAAIFEEVKSLNLTPFQKMPGTRRSRFEEVDRPALRPLPANPYVYGAWTGKRKVAPDYHVQIEKHFYSVPHTYLGRSVRGLIRPCTVEIYLGEERIASHIRSLTSGQYTTNLIHMPVHHREYAKWSARRFIRWAHTIGPQTTALIEANFARFQIPEQAYRRCMAILRLGSAFGHDVLEKACEIALEQQTLSSPAVKKIVKRVTAEQHQKPPIEHENIRGANYYTSNGTS